MKYLAFSLILIAFSASMFGQTKTVQVGYTHYETTADPQNGQQCVAGTAFCVGGGTTTNDIPADGCIPAKKEVVVTPGTYSNFIKGLDNDLSTLTKVQYTVKNKTTNQTLFDVEITAGAGWPTIPTTFTADLLVSPSTQDVEGTYYKSGDGILTIISPSIPGAAASNSAELIVTVNPTTNPTASSTTSNNITTYTSAGGVDETYTMEFTPTAIAAMSKTGKLVPGDVKYSELTTDHDGWYLMNGRNVSSISNVSANQAAAAIFGSALPDMDNKYFIADRTSGSRMTNVGQNTFTVANSNIQQTTLTTANDGTHSHDWAHITEQDDSGDGNSNAEYTQNGQGGYAAYNSNNPILASGSQHQHNFTIGTASPTSIDNRPVSKKMYAFVYLGE